MSAMVTVERWSNWACAGGVALGAVDVLEGTYGVALDASDACSLTIRHEARVPVGIRDVLRVVDAAGTVREYRVQSRSRVLADGRRTVSGLSPIADLGTAGRVRAINGGVTRYDLGGILTPAQFVTGYILTNLAADGLSWLSSGTFEIATLVTLTAPGDGWSRLDWLRQIANIAGAELRLRRTGETGYAIDMLAAIGASSVMAPVALGKNVIELATTEDDIELATAITVYGATQSGETLPANIGENAWTIGTITGSGPYWLPLTDPNGGAGPVAFASQFGTASTSQGAYLLTKTATTVQIVDSRISPDVAVQVSATTGLAAGDLVQIVADATATRLTELRAPNVSRLHRTDTVSTIRGERNLVKNGDLRTWTTASSLAEFSSVGSGTYAQGGSSAVMAHHEYPRNTPTALSGLVLNGAALTGATSISVRGAPPYARFYPWERFKVAGENNPYDITTYAQADASGVVTLLFGVGYVTAALTADYADGTAVTMFLSNDGVSPSGVQRPSAFPDDNGGRALLRLCTYSTSFGNLVPDGTALHLQHAGYRVLYKTGLPYVNVSAAVTIRAVSAISGINMPALALRDTVSGAIVSSVRAASVASGATSHQIITCERLLSADTTLAPCLYGGAAGFVSDVAGSAPPQFVAVRWVMMWLASLSGGAIPPQLGDAPYANLLFQRGNAALLARTLASRQITATLRDLSTAAGYSVTRESLVLGATLPLDDLGISVRIVGITYNATDPSDVQVVLDSRPTALATFLAAKVG